MVAYTAERHLDSAQVQGVQRLFIEFTCSL